MMLDWANIDFNFMGQVSDSIKWASAIGILATLLMTARFSFNRLVKKSKWQLSAVWLCNVILVVSLVLLISDVRLQKQQVMTSVLVTQNADIPALRQYLNTNNHPTDVYVLANALNINQPNGKKTTDTPADWQIIEHPELIMAQPSATQKLIIAGDGLTQAQYAHLQFLAKSHYGQASQIVFLASQKRPGLTNMSWEKQLVRGQLQRISGQLQNLDSNTNLLQLQLLDPSGAIIDIARLRDREHFTFTFPAKAVGNWMYTLRLIDSNNDVLTEEPFAFHVAPPLNRHILLLQSAPSFETKQFKNWAADSDASITMLTQISQAKFIAQYSNLAVPVDNLISGAEPIPQWGNYDMAIIDNRALLNLSAIQRKQLQATVERGLGLMIIADSQHINKANAEVLAEFTEIKLIELDDDGLTSPHPTLATWTGMQAEQAIATVSAQLVANNQNTSHAANIHILVTGQNDQPLIASESVGLGQVAISLINSSYQWQLSGQTNVFSHYWQTLLAKLAKSPKPPYWLPLSSTTITNHGQPLNVCAMVDPQQPIESSVTTSSALLVEVAMWQDPIDPNKVCGRIWPQQGAWHKLLVTQQDNSDEQHLFTYDDKDWQTWQQTLKHQASKAAEANSIEATATNANVVMSKLPIWFLLIITASILWVERKFFAD